MALNHSISTSVPVHLVPVHTLNFGLLSAVLFTLHSAQLDPTQSIELTLDSVHRRFVFPFKVDLNLDLDPLHPIRSIHHHTLSVLYSAPILTLLAHPTQLDHNLLQPTLDSISTAFYHLIKYPHLRPPLTSPSQRNRLISLSRVSNPNTVLDSPPLPFLIIQTASRYPNHTAVHWSDPSHSAPVPSLKFSFLHLVRHAFQFSKVIRARLSPSSNPLVGIYTPKNALMPLAMLAVSMAGAAYLNLDPTQPICRLQAILKQCPISLLLTYEFDQSHLTKTLLRGTNIPLINLTQQFHHLLFPALVTELGSEKSSSKTGQDLIRPTLDQISTFSIPDQSPKAELDTIISHLKTIVCPDQTAYIICTSGTTGTPKAIRITHSNLSAFLQNYQKRFGRKGPPDQSRVLQFASSAFDVMVMSIWDTLWVCPSFELFYFYFL
ncbi:hypothetical protein CROQUDRAFT_587059 [Cronartium quercuum f. sp. fusiforme G11]|uniref:AMP-dependent synthetase/ligase domain-containing protein n=1 Tax=Cronartium quercuum f. sp. fusiforme G11 TaxID=708437 RepID=A0A9P6NK95_9BASI|nr:hypothetical protein CROQUDRAFT_587059 [Cronartium quercuum f. sp. fusiforme G11]